MVPPGPEDVSNAANSGGAGDDAGGMDPSAGVARGNGGGEALPQAVEAGTVTVGSVHDLGAGGPGDVVVDRRTVFGNRFRMGDSCRDERYRDAVCDAHASLLGTDTRGLTSRAFDELMATIARRCVEGRGLWPPPVARGARAQDVRESLRQLAALATRVEGGESLRLLCHCAPKRCHADTLAGHILALVRQRSLGRSSRVSPGRDPEAPTNADAGAGGAEESRIGPRPPLEEPPQAEPPRAGEEPDRPRRHEADEGAGDGVERSSGGDNLSTCRDEGPQEAARRLQRR